MAVKHSALRDETSFPPPASLVTPSEAANNAAMAKKADARAGWRALGERVTQLRRQRGWNRTTLAARARVTVTTIRGCEEGSRVTQPSKIRAIAAALGVPLSRLEVDEKDPRVKHWTEEDYEIGNWYHNAPRQLKNRIWSLLELPDSGRALTDPQFLTLLDGWATLTHEQKVFVLNSFGYIKQHPANDETGGLDALAPVDPKTRGPQR